MSLLQSRPKFGPTPFLSNLIDNLIDNIDNVLEKAVKKFVLLL
jgi:hypothetical protein